MSRERFLLLFPGLLSTFGRRPFEAALRWSQELLARFCVSCSTARSFRGSLCARASRVCCPDLFRLWGRLARSILSRSIMRRFDRNDVFNQTIGLLVHFCDEFGILARLACGAFDRALLLYLAALNCIGK